MQYRYVIIAIAVLMVCIGCVCALSISTSTVRTEDGEIQSTTSSSGSAGSEIMSPGENITEKNKEEMLAVPEEGPTEEGAKLLNREGVVRNCIEGSGNELIIRFEPEYFERSDGTLDELVMEEVELKIHGSIHAVVLSDLTEFGMPGLQLVRLPEGMSLKEGIAYYEAFPEVRFAEPNYHISIYSANECAKGESNLTLALTHGEITGESAGEPTDEGVKTVDESITYEIQIDNYSF